MPTSIAARRARLTSTLCPDAYFTDGTRLYRVTAILYDSWEGERVELEDCRTLETRSYPADSLELLRLRLVRAAPSRGTRPQA